VSGSVKAAVMKQPGVIELEQFPLPELEPGAVLLEMSMSGVCGTDKHTSRAAPRPLEVYDVPTDIEGKRRKPYAVRRCSTPGPRTSGRSSTR
jgi:hypothetical protein